MGRYKIIALLVLLAGLGIYVYSTFIHPESWYTSVRRESVKVLTAAQTTRELTNAVGGLGWYIPLTNGAWIAVRYRDSHAGGIYSCAIARDSGGAWFESDRHFCGSFRYWPRLKEEVAAEGEMKKLDGQIGTNRVSRADSDNGMFPSYREMMAIESALDLGSARSALQKIGFREFQE